VVPAEESSMVLETLEAQGQEAWRIGRINGRVGTRGEQVEIKF
jgi:phosphoribosylaminoimidazole (AIR) synthetase